MKDELPARRHRRCPGTCASVRSPTPDSTSIRRNIADLKAALAAGRASEGFLTAVAPASTGYDAVNEYYASDRDYVFAIAEALREEYLEIVNAGLDPAGRRRRAGEHVRRAGAGESGPVSGVGRAADRRAQSRAARHPRGERVRYHICFGSWHVPHVADAPLDDIVDLMLRVKAGAYSIEAANARHEHEWRVWQKVKLPAGPDPDSRRRHASHDDRRASAPGGGSHRAICRPGRPGKRDRRHRLRLCAARRHQAGAPAGDVGQARGAGRGRADRLARALELAEVTEGTVSQEERRERRRTEFHGFNHEGHEEPRRGAAVRLAAEGGLLRCKRAQIQTALAVVGGLYLRSLTSRLSACFARRPIERLVLRSPPLTSFLL